MLAVHHSFQKRTVIPPETCGAELVVNAAYHVFTVNGDGWNSSAEDTKEQIFVLCCFDVGIFH